MHCAELHSRERWHMPSGYRIRRAVAGDEGHWVTVEVAAGEFRDEDSAWQRMTQNFGSFATTDDAVFLLESPDGDVIGTATATTDEFEGRRQGQVGWVGIAPKYQGQGLAKPLLATVVNELANRGWKEAFLTTQTTSWRAVGLYLGFSFKPALRPGTPDEARGWQMVAKELGSRWPESSGIQG